MSPTPILDRQQPPPAPKSVPRGLWMAVGAAIGVAPFFVPLEYLPRISLATFVLMPLMLLGGTLLHELGHVGAGLLLGFQFRRLTVGPWTVAREKGRLRLRVLSRRFMVGGHVLMIPFFPEQHLRARFCLSVAGGPIVTLLLFLLVAILPWGAATATLLAANALLATGSWIPYVRQGQYTDAKAILVLARQTPAGDRLASILYLVALDGWLCRPWNWPAQTVAKLAAPCGSRDFRASALILLYLYAAETAAQREVAAALEQVLAVSDEMSAPQRVAYFAEAAYFQGVARGDAGMARAWLRDARAVEGAAPPEDWDAAAMAAIAFAEGNQRDFERQRDLALQYLDRGGLSGSIAAFRERLERLSITGRAPSRHPPGRG